jgi:hypothetical protein
MPASAEFRLSVTRALGDQLGQALDALEPGPFTPAFINSLAHRPGVYQLYVDGVLAYVGKADKSLPQRLRKHHYKISGRLGIGNVECICLYVDEDLHAVAPEKILIKRYKSEGTAAWNFNGFGMNDPGKERDTTVFEDKHFDSIYPVNLDWCCEDIAAGHYTAASLLKLLKGALPYLFRYQAADFHADITLNVPMSTPTADELFTLLGTAIAAHDARWQITALPGYVVMYPKKGLFPSARRTYP